MNRRDFLKFVGSLPLIGLVGRLPILEQVDYLTADSIKDFEWKHDTNKIDIGNDFELGWHLYYQDENKEMVVEPIGDRIKLDDSNWHHIQFSYPEGKTFVDGKKA